jgi:hypothetical protein
VKRLRLARHETRGVTLACSSGSLSPLRFLPRELRHSYFVMDLEIEKWPLTKSGRIKLLHGAGALEIGSDPFRLPPLSRRKPTNWI